MNRIQSKLHRVGTYHVYKISLSYFDDKRYVLDDDGVNALKSTKSIKTHKVNKSCVFLLSSIVIGGARDLNT